MSGSPRLACRLDEPWIFPEPDMRALNVPPDPPNTPPLMEPSNMPGRESWFRVWMSECGSKPRGAVFMQATQRGCVVGFALTKKTSGHIDLLLLGVLGVLGPFLLIFVVLAVLRLRCEGAPEPLHRYARSLARHL